MFKYLFPALLVSINFLCFAVPVSAEEEMPVHKEKYRQQQIDKKTDEIRTLEDQISKLEVKHEEISSKHELAKKKNQSNRDAHAKAKDAYLRASQNVDLISPEQLSQFLKSYKETDKNLRGSDDELKKIEGEKNFILTKLRRLGKEKIEKEIEILEIKAKFYEDELREGVWVEGSGESILDEKKTMEECKQLTLDYAKRDAIEKGGKSLIESVTQVKMFELARDDIKKTAKVSIIDQDNSGDYGKAKRIISGDIIKFVAKVRIKVQSVATYNPYRERIKEMRSPEWKPPSVEGSEIKKGEGQDEGEKEELGDLKSKIEALEKAMKKDGEQQSKEKEQELREREQELRKREQELKEQEQRQQEKKQQDQTPRYEEKKEQDFVPLPMF